MKFRKTSYYTRKEAIDLGIARLLDGLTLVFTLGSYFADFGDIQLRKILKRQIQDRTNSIKLQSEAEMTSPPDDLQGEIEG